MRKGVTPVVSDVYSVPFPNAYRFQLAGESDKAFSERYFAYFTDFINKSVAAEDIALVIIEPIQGDSGIIKMPDHYVHLLYDFCQAHDILFGVDEVNQGLGRSGKMWSIEHFNVVPDLLSTAKSLANGIPLSAVIGRQEVMDSLNPPAHLFTTAGNPLACVACQAVLDVLAEDHLVERSAEMGEYAKSRLQAMQAKYDVIGDVRMYGLNGAIELVTNSISKTPDADSTLKIMTYCHQHGVILITLSSNVLRFQPPLNIPKETLDEAFTVIDAAFTALAAGEIKLPEDEKLGW